MKKGFTLMEILAVLLIIALVATFTLPAVQSVRVEVRHHQAKNAALKMAEAMRTFYKDTKGHLITGQVTGTDLSVDDDCEDVVAAGIPASGGAPQSMDQLFACGYLSVKDFSNLPYTFSAHPNPFNTNSGQQNPNEILLTVTGRGKNAGREFTVHRDMSIAEKNK